ncbi:MAG TPA: phosphatase PAP2 family protein [Actinomycetota bacterium]|nr:phosphatase PAP2 family protein [Actinomycetota bacterium]
MSKLVGRGSHRGSTWFGKIGDTIQQPPVWVALALTLSAGGGKGRRAAGRGSACYLAAHLLHLGIKSVVGRRRPPGAGRMRLGPASSSFPSGHAASDLAFSLGASQEMPLLFVPLSLGTLAAHWSLIRSRGHYVSDVFAGGVVGSAVALAAWRWWPPHHPVMNRDSASGSSAARSASPPPGSS